MVERLEDRLFLTIVYNVPVGRTLDIAPLSGIDNSPFGSNFNRMEVLLTSVPGVSYGQIYRLDGTQAYVWGSPPPNAFRPDPTNFFENRISAGQGFRYVSDGTGLGQTETIPVRFFNNSDFPQPPVYDTIQIHITSSEGAPQITRQPDPYVPLAPGQQYTLTVAATGNDPLTYQWYRGLSPNTNRPVAGATSTSLVVTGAATPTGNNDPERYWVRVRNNVGDAYSHTVTVPTGNPPTVIPGGPYDVPEGGGSVMLQGSQEGAVTFGWDFNDDDFFGGVQTLHGDEGGLTPVFYSLPDDDGPGATYTVRLRVTSIIDLPATASTTVRVVNVAPTAAFRGDGAGVVAFGDQYDPSPADRAAGYTYGYDFDNDGVFEITGSSAASAALPAQYMAGYLAGTFVRGRITDKDGGFHDYLAGVNGRVLTVTTADDAGGQRGAWVGAPLSLRSAIEIAELDAAPEQIVFDPAIYAAGTATIKVDASSAGASAFAINTPVIISGPTGNRGVALEPVADKTLRAFNVAPSGSLTLERMTLRNFSSGGLGGAVYNEGRLAIRSSTFNNNTAAGGGGAVYNNGGIVTALTSSFWQNTASGGGLGGAIFSRNGSVELTHVTASANTAAAGGRGLYLLSDGAGAAASALVRDSILGQSDASVTDFAADVANGGNAPISSGDHNLIRNGPAFGGGASSADPRVIGLTRTGRPTLPIALFSDSPAVDNAAALPGVAADQRGVPFNGAPDIGAYEEAESLVVTTEVDEDDGTSSPLIGAGTSLREAIAFAQYHPGLDTITFAPQMAGRRIDLLTVDPLVPSPAFNAALFTDTDMTIQGFAAGPTVTIGRAAGAPQMSLFYEQFGNLTLNDLVLADGDAPYRGGAVFQGFLNPFYTQLTVNRCTFTNNRAPTGGAIAAGYCFINDSTFVDNTALVGGAVYQSMQAGFAVGQITQSTFVGNRVTTMLGISALGGSAVYITNGSVRQSTFVGNQADVPANINVPGGALTASGQAFVPVLLENNLIAGNVGKDLVLESVDRPLDAKSRNNLIGAGGSGGLVDGVNGNIVGVADPGVFDLADNGGRTRTVALRPGSRAINAGATIDGLTADQRGVARPQYFAPDIGAYEFNSYATPVNDAPTYERPTDPPATDEDSGAQTVANYIRNISPGPSDEAGQTLTFNIAATGGTGLLFTTAPSIDPLTGALTYRAAPNSYGSATFSVTLSDNGPNDFPNANTSVTRTFTITVNSVNDAPVVANPLPDQSTLVESPVQFTAPSGAFTDVDAGDVLSYSATQADGSPLPAWLNFNPTTRTFSGTPLEPGTFILRYIATDGAGASTADEFTLVVRKRLALTPPAGQSVLTGISTPIDLGSFDDADPSAGPWDVTVDWGDGSSETFPFGQNLLAKPATLEQRPWVPLRATVVPDAAQAPDGSFTADKLVADAAFGQHYVQQGVEKPARALRYVLSFYVKAAGRDAAAAYLGDDAGNFAAARFNLAAATSSRVNYGSGMVAEAATITPVGGGWSLVTLTATTTATTKLRAYLFAGDNQSFAGDNFSGVLVADVRLGQAPAASLGARPHTYAQSGGYDVRVTVANKNGRVDTAAFQANVKPIIVTPPSPQSTPTGVATSFDLGSFVAADPSAGPWDVTVDWGDGSAPTAYQVGPNLLTTPLETWGGLGASISSVSNQAPDGTATARQLTASSTPGQHYVNFAITKPAQSLRYTLSTYVKGNGQPTFAVYLGDDAGNFAAARFDLSTQSALRLTYGSGMTPEAATITPVGDGWNKVTLTATTTATTRLRSYLFAGTNHSFTGDDSSGVLIWSSRLAQTPPSELGSRSHAYAQAGDYAVRVRVADAGGGVDETGFSVNVKAIAVTPPPNQSGSAGVPTSLDLGAFDADPLAGPWDVTVDWGDGSSETFPFGQNLLAKPATLEQRPWVPLRATVVPDAAQAPDGSFTADKLVADAAFGQHYVQQGVEKPARALRYVLSFYVKAAGRDAAAAYLGDDAGNFAAARFNLAAATSSRVNYGSGMVAEAATITPVGGGWSLVTLTATTTATTKLRAYLFAGDNQSFAGDNFSGVLVADVRLGQAPGALGSRTHAYVAPGSYYVKVTVANRLGNSQQAGFKANISVGSATLRSLSALQAPGEVDPSDDVGSSKRRQESPA